MKKSKKERAREIAIEQDILKRGYESVKGEFISDSGSHKDPIYSRIRLEFLLKWNRPLAQ